MNINLMTKDDIEDLKEIFEDDDMTFEKSNIEKFLQTSNTYAFVLRNEEKVIGFAYGYGLTRLDGKVMYYLHSIGILPRYQSSGYGVMLMDYIVSFAKENGFSEIFVITDKANVNACKLYEKFGLKSEVENEIVYVKEFK